MFMVDGGTSFIELSSLDGADAQGEDARRLSTAVFDIQTEKIIDPGSVR